MYKCCTMDEKGDDMFGTLVYMLQRAYKSEKSVEKITSDHLESKIKKYCHLAETGCFFHLEKTGKPSAKYAKSSNKMK